MRREKEVKKTKRPRRRGVRTGRQSLQGVLAYRRRGPQASSASLADVSLSVFLELTYACRPRRRRASSPCRLCGSYPHALSDVVVSLFAFFSTTLTSSHLPLVRNMGNLFRLLRLLEGPEAMARWHQSVRSFDPLDRCVAIFVHECGSRSYCMIVGARAIASCRIIFIAALSITSVHLL